MKSPLTGKPMKLLTEKCKLTFRTKAFDVICQYYLCEDSGEQFESAEQMEINLKQVYDQYHAKHKKE